MPQGGRQITDRPMRLVEFFERLVGWDVLDKIAAVPRDANDRPLEDIRMRCKVER